MQKSELNPQNGQFSLGLLKDHLDLVSLEMGYEKKEGWRRLLSVGVGAILLISSYVFLQLGLIAWFLRMGFKWGSISLILGVFYFLAGTLTLFIFGGRQKELGRPFQGSLSELKRSFSWIEKNFL